MRLLWLSHMTALPPSSKSQCSTPGVSFAFSKSKHTDQSKCRSGACYFAAGRLPWAYHGRLIITATRKVYFGLRMFWYESQECLRAIHMFRQSASSRQCHCVACLAWLLDQDQTFFWRHVWLQARSTMRLAQLQGCNTCRNVL